MRLTVSASPPAHADIGDRRIVSIALGVDRIRCKPGVKVAAGIGNLIRFDRQDRDGRIPVAGHEREASIRGEGDAAWPRVRLAEGDLPRRGERAPRNREDGDAAFAAIGDEDKIARRADGDAAAPAPAFRGLDDTRRARLQIDDADRVVGNDFGAVAGVDLCRGADDGEGFIGCDGDARRRPMTLAGTLISARTCGMGLPRSMIEIESGAGRAGTVVTPSTRTALPSFAEIAISPRADAAKTRARDAPARRIARRSDIKRVEHEARADEAAPPTRRCADRECPRDSRPHRRRGNRGTSARRAPTNVRSSARRRTRAPAARTSPSPRWNSSRSAASARRSPSAPASHRGCRTPRARPCGKGRPSPAPASSRRRARRNRRAFEFRWALPWLPMASLPRRFCLSRLRRLACDGQLRAGVVTRTLKSTCWSTPFQIA